MKLNIKINSLYICVKDMRRAISFYEILFDHSVDIEDDIFSIFKLNDFNFCLFNNENVNEHVLYGYNCLPSFEVNNINLLIEKLDLLKVKIVFPLSRINHNLVLEFEDSEGNHIEAYYKIK